MRMIVLTLEPGEAERFARARSTPPPSTRASTRRESATGAAPRASLHRPTPELGTVVVAGFNPIDSATPAGADFYWTLN